jgi:hypothetical protein
MLIRAIRGKKIRVNLINLRHLRSIINLVTATIKNR